MIELDGRRTLRVGQDIADLWSLAPGVDASLAAWVRIDVLVNNGRYIGPGHMDQLLDTPVELLDLHLEAYVMAPVILTKLLLPQMLYRGDADILVIKSASDSSNHHLPPAHTQHCLASPYT